MPPPMHPAGFALPPLLAVETFYALSIVVLCLVIYWRTHELYALSSYKGIAYFRNSFLFFAIAYLFRFLSISFSISLHHLRTQSPLVLIGFFVFVYASTMALFCLIQSALWKKHQSDSLMINNTLHLTALLIALIAVFSRSPLLFLVTQGALLLFAAGVSVRLLRSTKKIRFSGFSLAYLLLFLFWILHLIILLLPTFLLALKVILYAISITLFLVIIYAVLRRTRRR